MASCVNFRGGSAWIKKEDGSWKYLGKADFVDGVVTVTKGPLGDVDSIIQAVEEFLDVDSIVQAVEEFLFENTP